MHGMLAMAALLPPLYCVYCRPAWAGLCFLVHVLILSILYCLYLGYLGISHLPPACLGWSQCTSVRTSGTGQWMRLKRAERRHLRVLFCLMFCALR